MSKIRLACMYDGDVVLSIYLLYTILVLVRCRSFDAMYGTVACCCCCVEASREGKMNTPENYFKNNMILSL